MGQVRLVLSNGAEITNMHVELNDFRVFVMSAHKKLLLTSLAGSRALTDLLFID